MMGHNDMTCGMAQSVGVGMEEASYMGGFARLQPRNDPYSNIYNPRWRNHPNFSWKDPNITTQPRPMGPPSFQQGPPFQPSHHQVQPPPPQQLTQEKKP